MVLLSCLTHTEFANERKKISVIVLRSPEAHEYQLKFIKSPEHKVTCRVNGPSPLNVLKYFDVRKAFPPDMMYDLVEGVVPLIVKLVVCQAHKDWAK